MRRLLTFLLICTSAVPQGSILTSNSSREGDAGYVVRINVNLVQMDAVVTDAKGKRVTDLNAHDFEILQDGVAQKITNFSYVSEGTNSRAVPSTAGAKIDSSLPAPPTPLRREQVHRVIALVVDDLGLSFTSTAYIHAALKMFVDHNVQPGDLVAIIRTSGGVGALQQFTADKRLLYAAIDHVKFKFTTRAASFSPINLARTLEPPSVGQAHTAATIANMPDAFKNMEAAYTCMEQTNSTIGSLGAIRYVVQGLRDLPGRKALVLFSENMQMSQRPDKANDPAASVCDYSEIQDMLRRLTDAAERSAVVIYTVDARGLTSLSADAASNPFGGGPVSSSQAARETLTQEYQENNKAYFASQGGMQYLAEETGGSFTIHNDVAGAIRDAVEDSGHYYLIGYHPPANTFEEKNGRTKFHRVTVRVKRFGLKVRSRTGFYGFPGQENENPELSREQQFGRALTSPFAQNDIALRMTALFSEWEKPVLTTMLYLDVKDLTFTRDAQGNHNAAIEAVAMTFDENGNAVDVTQRTDSFSTTDKDYELAMKNGVILKMKQVIGKPGPYHVRVAVRDQASQKMGSANQFIEVPDLKQGHLALSGIVLKQVDPAEISSPAPEELNQAPAIDPEGNAAVRIFKPGEKIGWYYQVLNAKSGPDQQASLKVQVRLFRNGSEITRTEPAMAHLPQAAPGKRLATSGHMVLTPQFPAGDYALQLIVTDTLAKKKHSTASQWIDFTVENP